MSVDSFCVMVLSICMAGQAWWFGKYVDELRILIAEIRELKRAQCSESVCTQTEPLRSSADGHKESMSTRLPPERRV